MAKSGRELFQERLKRFADSAELRRPDRVPLVSLADLFMTRYAGLSNAEAAYDYGAAAAAFKSSCVRLGWDMAPPIFGLVPGPALDLIGSKQHRWPGRQLAAHLPAQFVEGEYLHAEEYDEFLADPGGFALRRLLPRLGAAFEPLSLMPPLHTVAGGNAILALGMAIGSSPELDEALRTLSRFGAEMARYAAVCAKLTNDLEDEGFPVVAATATLCPFDWVADMLRGLRGVMLDMRRCPDKLLAAVDLYTDSVIAATTAAALESGNPRVFVPLHRGADDFMSDADYATFYWPGLKKMLLGFVEAGLTPLAFFEGQYTKRLRYLADLPPGKIVGHFDVVDRDEFKRILGDVMCFWGDVPGSLLCTGTPQQVQEYVKRLIADFSERGTLMVDGATGGVPFDARPENVEAMTQAVIDHGVS